MDLAARGREGPNLALKGRSVLFDSGGGIVLRQSEVQLAFAVGARESANARREAVDEPRQRAQLRGAENIQAGLLANCRARDPSRHSVMLQEAEPAVQSRCSSWKAVAGFARRLALRYSFTHV